MLSFCLSVLLFQQASWADPPLVYKFQNGNELRYERDKGVFLFNEQTDTLTLVQQEFPKQFLVSNVNSTWVNNILGQSNVPYHAYAQHADPGSSFVVLEIGNQLFFVDQNGKREKLQTVERPYANVDYEYSGIKSTGLNWKVSQEVKIGAHHYRVLMLPHLAANSFAASKQGDIFLIREDGVSSVKINVEVPKEFSKGFAIKTAEGQDRIVLNNTSIGLSEFKETKAQGSVETMVLDEDGLTMRPADEIVRRYFADYAEVVKKEGVVFDAIHKDVLEGMRIGLTKKQMRSVMLVGDNGSSKTEHIRTFVSEVGKGKYSKIPADTRFILVTEMALIGGARYEGMFSARLNALIAVASRPGVVLILDDTHLVKGTGATAEGRAGFFKQLAPYIKSGSISAIGATNLENHRAYFTDPDSRGVMTEINVKPIPKSMMIDVMKTWSQRKGLPILGNDIYQRILTVSGEYDPRPSDLVKAIDLLDEVCAEFDDSKHVSIENVNTTSIRKYNLDEAEFKPNRRDEKLEKFMGKMDESIYGLAPIKEALKREAQKILYGSHNKTKPRVQMMFVGPKGLAKTEMARAYAAAMGLEFYVIDFGKFNNYDSENLLREVGNQILKNSHTVFLFDEVEKAGLSIQEALRTLMLTDSMTMNQSLSGQLPSPVKVKTTNMTMLFGSNAGQDYILAHPDEGDTEGLRRAMQMEGHAEGRAGLSEFMVDRMMGIHVFHPPKTAAEFKAVLELRLNKVIAEQEEEHRREIKVEKKEAALNKLAKEALGEKSFRRVIGVLEEEARFQVSEEKKKNPGNTPLKIRCFTNKFE